jgi:P-loop containing NTP hydrolase pore-1/C-terminal domain on Strawberry notch homologue
MPATAPAPRQGAALPLFAPQAPDKVSGLFHAGTILARLLEKGRVLDTRLLRGAVEEAFGATDAEGAWVWKDAYEAVEVAQVLFLQKFGPAMAARAAAPPDLLAMLARLAARLPSQTRRSEESQQLQQFSTPITLGAVAARAARIGPGDLVLEPSAGTGLLAVFAQMAGAALALNEIAATRAGLLARLFRDVPVTRHNAEQLHDHLPPEIRPSVVLMNPPFSASPAVAGRYRAATLKHIGSALARLIDGGRLVAISGNGFAPDNPAWRDSFLRWQESARLVFSAGLAGKAYARHGTTADTRLTVIDKHPADRPGALLPPHGMADSAEALLELVERHVPDRVPLCGAVAHADAGKTTVAVRPQRPVVPGNGSAAPARTLPLHRVSHRLDATAAVELAYETRDWTPTDKAITEALYEGYEVQSVVIPGAKPHPTKLVQSAAMASVAPPKPSYRPHVLDRLVTEGVLSDAQLESLIYAGEAHSGFLSGHYTVDETLDTLSAVAPETAGAVRFRRGWFLGDGTGAGKGRQVAGIILDNWLKGRRRALWISKSDKLIEDAVRDWTALGGAKTELVALSKYRQGATIELGDAILFTTYATLRTEERQGKCSRVQQIVDWLGRDPGSGAGFEGVIVFDEAHAMANAAGDRSARGEKAPSQQGRAGLRLQNALANARVVYVSATGATTVNNLAYASRLGLWGTGDFPFASRPDFIAAMEAGGIAAMEVISRDLKALGLYASRALSYEGVTYEIVEHALTCEQVAIYDAYADAFKIIHQNIEAALEAVNITGSEGTLNRNAKSAARSAFEANKQRFFNHLLTAMKCPTLIKAIERDLDEGHAVVVQVVSTGEALLDRRLAEIPAAEWSDIAIDITPREYVLDYLAHSFPTQLFEVVSDDDGNLHSRPLFDADGNPVLSREAVERRDRLIEQLAALPPVQAALDQIVWHFGTEQVAEVTGRAKRVVRKTGAGGDRLCVESRPASANFGETQAFMDDEKRILVFSDAGGTGRSYHADLGARNRRLRIHYLLEAGWKADTAIQGLGRSNRTNQAQPPVFRPIATDVKGEKRFLSTIARRLDTLGAITRGQRETGGQGLFRADDNLESAYAKAALRQFYHALHAGRIACCSLATFAEHTGLELTDQDGSLREDLPPITRFLNRMLALRIRLQNALFEEFEARLESQIEGAIASGTYDVGVETLIAESFEITERRTVYTHVATGAETRSYRVRRKDRNRPLSLDEAHKIALQHRACPRACRGQDPGGELIVNPLSHRAAVRIPAPSRMHDDGSVEERIRLIRPMGRETMSVRDYSASRWEPSQDTSFATLWEKEVDEVPAFSTTEFHVITGLLLPIWDRLPAENMRVYRLQTDGGERVIGRLVTPEALGAVYTALGVDADHVLSADDVWGALMERGASVALAGGLSLRRARVMDAERCEVMGFSDGAVDQLKALGLMSEIITWRLRLFIPTTGAGVAVLGALLDRHPVLHCTARART